MIYKNGIIRGKALTDKEVCNHEEKHEKKNSANDGSPVEKTVPLPEIETVPESRGHIGTDEVPPVPHKEKRS